MLCGLVNGLNLKLKKSGNLHTYIPHVSLHLCAIDAAIFIQISKVSTESYYICHYNYARKILGLDLDIFSPHKHDTLIVTMIKLMMRRHFDLFLTMKVGETLLKLCI